MKRRRLNDLYVRGRELEITDGEGPAVKIWLNKLNEIERESVIRRASAAKARLMIDADDEQSDLFNSVYADTRSGITARSELILFLIADDAAAARRRIEAEISANEETWGKDEYLQGLVDSWIGDENNEGLSATIVEEPDDPDANRVRAELDRFEEEVRTRVEVEIQALQKDWEDVALDVLWRKSAHKILEHRAEEEFVREYQRQQLFYAVREPDSHRKRYFATVQEIDDIDEDLRKHLTEQYETLIVPPLEGKDSPPQADSSELSAPPEPETSEASGRVAAMA